MRTNEKRTECAGIDNFTITLVHFYLILANLNILHTSVCWRSLQLKMIFRAFDWCLRLNRSVWDPYGPIILTIQHILFLENIKTENLNLPQIIGLSCCVLLTHWIHIKVKFHEKTVKEPRLIINCYRSLYCPSFAGEMLGNIFIDNLAMFLWSPGTESGTQCCSSRLHYNFVRAIMILGNAILSIILTALILDCHLFVWVIYRLDQLIF